MSRSYCEWHQLIQLAIVDCCISLVSLTHTLCIFLSLSGATGYELAQLPPQFNPRPLIWIQVTFASANVNGSSYFIRMHLCPRTSLVSFVCPRVKADAGEIRWLRLDLCSQREREREKWVLWFHFHMSREIFDTQCVSLTLPFADEIICFSHRFYSVGSFCLFFASITFSLPLSVH